MQGSRIPILLQLGHSDIPGTGHEQKFCKARIHSSAEHCNRRQLALKHGCKTATRASNKQHSPLWPKRATQSSRHLMHVATLHATAAAVCDCNQSEPGTNDKPCEHLKAQSSKAVAAGCTLRLVMGHMDILDSAAGNCAGVPQFSWQWPVVHGCAEHPCPGKPVSTSPGVMQVDLGLCVGQRQ